jgi:hypothetical protein
VAKIIHTFPDHAVSRCRRSSDHVGLACRLLVDLANDGQAEVLVWPDGGLPRAGVAGAAAWPLDADALEDLSWYLED